ncbi:aminotransferase class I/II-fold pyridoxal phosphate-dependent enzyme [Neobacillus ginsengisoli]|uniref:Arginine/lysine/ornithine decarboxylase n=1 Tax=Neobacillus ginsengisoli TaxID=904295 RepID=A0ABT9Y2R7_9BACI|nr:aminotransferase class I/II-fold pyridoxal phosphate-dependent enzyme [Neobacillus ginsengisoli]MDQ0202103.1 arginine/lysine/ornithine decarboxylase [Neobacillus ginsengisoli]
MNNQLKMPLYQALVEHARKNPISFHVPGHKYGSIFKPTASVFQQILQIDATELTGLDDLHSPDGIIEEAEALLAELYQVRKSFFLVNGSTVGNLAMIMAACTEGTHVLVQRNCHKSVMNALKLAKVNPVFLEPEFNREWKVATGVSLETVKEAIHLYPEAKAIILTYPNYYGMVYDLQSVIHEAHSHDIPVLVDEAHGPHFIIGEPFPSSAIQMGADIVVQSAHKTLPAMTMGSFLHFNSHLVNVDKLKDYLHMFQSSSPSYPIMASLDLARNYLAAYERQDVRFLIKEIGRFKRELADIPSVRVLEYPNKLGDPLKVTIQSACGISGFELQKRFEEIGIFTELADPYNILLILPLLKEKQDYPLTESVEGIKKALKGLSFQKGTDECQVDNRKISELAIAYKDMPDYEEKDIPISKAVGEVCAETVIPYPPGIPLLLRGEEATNEKIQYLKKLIDNRAKFQGGNSLEDGFIKVFWTS